jgi:nucleoside-diphosphate-sugar epimerase
MKILLLGSSGIVGDGIKRYLLDNGIIIYGTSRYPQEDCENFIPIQINLINQNSFNEICTYINKVDAIIYNAAILPSTNRGNGDFYDSLELHVVLLSRILEYINITDKKLIYISGYRLANIDNEKLIENIPYNNKNSYFTTKLFGELLCNQFIINGNSNIIVFRVSSPFGYVNSTNSVLPLFLNKILNSEDIQLIGRGERRQVFTFSEDIGHAALLAIKKDFSGFLTITSEYNFSMLELAESLKKAIPNSSSSILYSDEIENGVNNELSISIEKAKNQIKYEPLYSFDFVIKKIIKRIKK